MRKLISLIIIVLVLGISLYVYWFYYNSISEGTREGLLQKFSRKGNIFKTYEGEMVQMGYGPRNGNLSSNYFYFSVEDEQLADSLEHRCQGKIVLLHYIQYRRSLPWRGEDYNGKNQEMGQYVVDKVEQVKEPTY